MKNALAILMCMSAMSALAQGEPVALESLGGVAAMSGPGCVANCDAILEQCRQQCRGTKARAHEAHFDEGDVPVPQCLDGCEMDASICKKDC
jgi:hypothetical protein